MKTFRVLTLSNSLGLLILLFSSHLGFAISPQGLVDPCPEVGKPSESAEENVFQLDLVDFGGCLRRLTVSAELAGNAIQYFKNFQVLSDQRPLSAMSDQEMSDYLRIHSFDPMTILTTNSSRASELRERFSDSDLDELIALDLRQKEALQAAEIQIFQAMDAHPDLVKHFRTINRYGLLQILHDNPVSSDSMNLAQEMGELFSTTKMKVPDFNSFPTAMLHPYAIQAVIPSEGNETKPLNRDSENPFDKVFEAVASLAGDPSQVIQTRNLYAQVRDKENPPIPKHPPAAQDAVRVAVIDSGIDFISHPDLALYLGNGEGGQISSGDYADGGSNPWLPAIATGDFSHGTGTTASVLTIMANSAPETLTNHKLDLAMWKVSTARDLLQGPVPFWSNYGGYENHTGAYEAIIKRIQGAEVKPKIVSISMSLAFQSFTEKLGLQGILKNSPWLWVMAAGNDGLDIDEIKTPLRPCFNDVPEDQRVDDRILCVGALIRTPGSDEIAAYSDFGKRVDVYALESYTKLCPGMTSCATPAVAGAAAAIAAEYPRLTPEEIKQVILAASEERTLAVAAGDGNAENLRTVKVFDPPAMLNRALEIARSIKGAASSN